MLDLEEVIMRLDEFEAIRLADLDGFYQEQAAEQMRVSRATFSRIIESAHRKLADVLAEALKVGASWTSVLPTPWTISRFSSVGKKITSMLGLTRSDHRSGRLVAVIECILNQNARDLGAATYPALNTAFLGLCLQYDIGILQIPCPEMRFMGLRRERPPGKTIREVMDTPAGRQCCRVLSQNLVNTIREYQKSGYRVLAILGGNPESPGCAVHSECRPTNSERLTEQSGVLMKVLQEELRACQIEIPFRGMRDYRPDLLSEDLRWLEQLFGNE
jgi:predicted secreted protein